MKTILKSVILLVLFLIIYYGDLFAYNVIFDAYTEEGVDLRYRYDSYSNNCEVNLCVDKNYSGVVTIPSEVSFESKTLTVIGIGEAAFRNCNRITTIIIPSTVSYIRNSAFKGCSNLSFVNIPNGLVSLGTSVFCDCSNLLSIDLPESLTSIDSNTFSGCSSLSSIGLPEGLTSIGSEAFSGCSNISSIDLPEKLASIGSLAFQGCIKLKEVYILQNVKSVGSQAFMGCDSLRKVGINCNAIVSNHYNSYGYNTGLSEIFGSQVRQYILGDSIRGIGQYAFSNCINLGSINIPYNISYISPDAFKGCDNLMEVSISSDAIVSKDKTEYSGDNFSKLFGSQVKRIILGDSINSIGSYSFYNCTNLVSFEIPNKLKKIGSFSFKNCSQLISLSLPPTVELIGANAFENCSSLKTINIPESIASINGHTFSNCFNLEAINLSERITSIGSFAFQGCKRLKEVFICENVKSMGNQAFMGCDSLTKVSINSNEIVGKSYDKNSQSGLSYIFGPQVQQYVLGDSIRQIGDYAFYGCQDLNTLVVPKNVNQISYTAFLYCKNLVSIQVNSDNPIYDSRNDCNAIMQTNQNELVLSCQNSVLPDETEILGSFAFSTIQQGANICLPDNINNIKSNAFIIADQIPNIPFILVNKGSKTLLMLWNYGFVSARNAPYQIGKSISYENQLLAPTINVDSTTQATACCTINNFYDGYTYSQDSGFCITNLWPETDYPKNWFHVAINKDNVYYYIYTPKFSTKSLYLNIECDNISPTSFSLYGTYADGDAILSARTINVDGIIIDGDSCFMKGLEPSTNYSCKFSVQVLSSNTDETRLYTVTKTVNTGELEFETFAPKVISQGNVIVSAQTNLNDDEKVGFAWRRTDWTSDFESNRATSYLYEGMMEGIIYNLNSNHLWRYCPYYVSASGKYHYGNWKGIDPTDFSYFEPIVHTFTQVVVAGNSAQVKGSALQGTDNLSRQGFKCWPQNLGIDVPMSSTIVDADGQMMDATFDNLEYNTPYYYVAFVTTAAGASYYGAIRTFTTEPNLNGIEDIEIKQPQNYAEGVYSISGYKIANSYEEIKGRLPRGIYIVNGRKLSISH